MDIFLISYLPIFLAASSSPTNFYKSFLFSVSQLSKYHSYEDLEAEFRGFERKYPDLAQLHSIGQSVEKRELYVLQV